MRLITELHCSLHDLGRLNEFKYAVKEHKQDDQAAHDAGGPDAAFRISGRRSDFLEGNRILVCHRVRIFTF